MEEKILKQRKREVLNKKLNRLALSFLEENYSKFVFEDTHHTLLNDCFKNNKKRFFEYFIEKFFLNCYFFVSEEDFYEVMNNLNKQPLIMVDRCYNCNKSIVYGFDGINIFNVEKDFECFNEKVFSVNINIPSGKLLLTDWFPYGKDILNVEYSDINSLIGRYKESKNYEKLNVMHFYVGNTCPTISKKQNSLIIECPGSTEEDDEIFYGNGYEPIGHICTDLWWATGIDLEEYKDLLTKTGVGIDSEVFRFLKEAIIIDVEPGEYCCQTFYEACNIDDYSKSQVFIKIEKK